MVKRAAAGGDLTAGERLCRIVVRIEKVRARRRELLRELAELDVQLEAGRRCVEHLASELTVDDLLDDAASVAARLEAERGRRC